MSIYHSFLSLSLSWNMYIYIYIFIYLFIYLSIYLYENYFYLYFYNFLYIVYIDSHCKMTSLLSRPRAPCSSWPSSAKALASSRLARPVERRRKVGLLVFQTPKSAPTRIRSPQDSKSCLLSKREREREREGEGRGSREQGAGSGEQRFLPPPCARSEWMRSLAKSFACSQASCRPKAQHRGFRSFLKQKLRNIWRMTFS